jgi:hypothetical protein
VAGLEAGFVKDSIELLRANVAIVYPASWPWAPAARHVQNHQTPAGTKTVRRALERFCQTRRVVEGRVDGNGLAGGLGKAMGQPAGVGGQLHGKVSLRGVTLLPRESREGFTRPAMESSSTARGSQAMEPLARGSGHR